MALTVLAVLTLLPSMSSREGAYSLLLILLICMLIPHIVFGGHIVYRITLKTSTKFGLAIRIPKIFKCAFCQNEEEMLPVTVTVGSVIRSQHIKQGFNSTESTALVR